MPLNSTDFTQILDKAPSGHIKTIQKVIKNTNPRLDHQNPHQLQEKL